MIAAANAAANKPGNWRAHGSSLADLIPSVSCMASQRVTMHRACHAETSTIGDGQNEIGNKHDLRSYAMTLLTSLKASVSKRVGN